MYFCHIEGRLKGAPCEDCSNSDKCENLLGREPYRLVPRIEEQKAMDDRCPHGEFTWLYCAKCERENLQTRAAKSAVKVRVWEPCAPCSCPSLCAELDRCEMEARPANGPNPKQAMGDRKIKLALVPSAAVIYAARALQYGAFHAPRDDGQPPGYGPYNWRETKVEAMTYAHAALRHLYDWIDGLNTTHDSKAPTLGHAIACLAILADAIETNSLIDNRPATGAAPRLLAPAEGLTSIA